MTRSNRMGGGVGQMCWVYLPNKYEINQTIYILKSY